MISFEEFISDYIEAAVYILPFFTQLGIPLGLTFFIMLITSSYDSFYTFFGFVIALGSILMLADLLAYYIGHRYGRRPLDFISSKFGLNGVIESTSKMISRNSFNSIFMTRTILLGGAPVTNYLLGIEKYDVKKFALFNFICESIYVLLFGLVGFVFRDFWEVLFSLLQDISGILIALLMIYFIIRHIFKNKNKDYNVKNV